MFIFLFLCLYRTPVLSEHQPNEKHGNGEKDKEVILLKEVSKVVVIIIILVKSEIFIENCLILVR